MVQLLLIISLLLMISVVLPLLLLTIMASRAVAAIVVERPSVLYCTNLFQAGTSSGRERSCDCAR